MKVFICSHSARFGGSISRVKDLIAAIGRVAPQHDYYFTVPPDLGFEESCHAAPRHAIRVYRCGGLVQRWLWETFTLPGLVEKVRPDVILNTANRGLASPPCPQATLIADPHLFYPFSAFGSIDVADRLRFWYHRYYLRRSLKSTRLLFCQTAVARERLRSLYGNGCAIRLCPKVVSPAAISLRGRVSEPAPLHELRDKFKLFVLARYYAHKNLEIIPRLFQKHRDRLRDVAMVLTITAEQHPNAARLLKRIEREGLERNVITVGPLKQEDLPAYYGYTDALFLPTVLESFSGTYLEAMQFDRPILTSDMDFARCVCGDAALYFDPHDEDSICHAILRLKEDAMLRRQLVEAGKARRAAQTLTWDEIARSVMRELELLVENEAGPILVGEHR